MNSIHAFIDTCIYENAGFSFAGPDLSRLVRDTKSGLLQLYTTEITLAEIRRHMQDKTEAVCGEIAACIRKDDGKVLRSSSSPEARKFSELQEKRESVVNEIVADLNSQLGMFLEQTGTTILSTSVNVNRVFELYFSAKPPFGTGKKKNEFPDAFVIETLREWCEKNLSDIYVVSSDHDMENACNDVSCLINLKSIAGLFDLVARQRRLAHTLIVDWLRANSGPVKDCLKVAFEDYTFELEDQDGYVNEIDVTGLTLEGEPLVLEISDDCTAQILITATVDFSADISYKDLDNAIYDREEQEYIFWETVNEELIRTATVRFRVEGSFDMESGFFELNDTRIDDDNSPFFITVNEDLR